jgi:hypothetical protein
MELAGSSTSEPASGGVASAESVLKYHATIIVTHVLPNISSFTLPRH